VGLRILCYHEIEALQRSRFELQLDWFKRCGYEFLSLSGALERLDEKCMVASFDDGDHTLFEVAKPVLDEHGIKAIVYLTTDYVLRGNTYRSSVPTRAVTWEQLGVWLEAGHEIGSHTHTHANLTQCTDEEALAELAKSREIVRRELGVDIRHFAYPWGQHDRRTRGLIAGDGNWQTAASIDRGENGKNTDFLCLKRDLINPEMKLGKVRLKMFIGSQPYLYRMQKTLRKAAHRKRGQDGKDSEY
jgi:peptidoglycan/xylan/chitin deacetylase (PgdA/CDA1 family)